MRAFLTPAAIAAVLMLVADHWFIRCWDEEPPPIPGLDDARAAVLSVGPISEAHGHEVARPPLSRTEPATIAVHPNPARDLVHLSLAIPQRSAACLEVVDLAGRRVLSRDLGVLVAGDHRLTFRTGSRFPPGVYWVRILMDPGEAQARVVLR